MLEKYQRNIHFRQSLPPCLSLLPPSALNQAPSPFALPVLCFEGGLRVCLCKQATSGRVMEATWDARLHLSPPCPLLEAAL